MTLARVKTNPYLRFGDMPTNWETKKLADLSERISDGIHSTPKYSTTGSYHFINGNNLVNGKIEVNDKTKLVDKDEYDAHYKELNGQTILLSINGTIGNIAYYNNEKVLLGKSACYINLLKSVDKQFIFYMLQTPKAVRYFNSELTGSTIKNLSLTTIKNTKLLIPDLEEQQKIANFLTSVDKKIQQLIEKQSLLQQYKKGIMQKLYSQEIRFKNEQGNDFPDWEEKRFGELFQRITNKNKENNSNVLTISAQRGLVNQEKYFNKSVSAKDVTGYYLIEKGNFAYNKSYSKGYPMGAIKRLNNYEKGVVSTLYICFKAINDVNDQFYEQYFDGGLLNREIHKIAQEGARNHGLLNVSVTEFFRDIKIEKPCLAEQNKIASFLGALDKKIEFTNQQTEQTKSFKKGLLQQMFV